ncbi:hypothetical protein M758_11G024300 [Ceratodon purpureus]|nr:hypothetical protein M758_11G024200 [Ceratodon purpureus]KAG0600323.1 hypothetical protein M758_11G024300 [Ceratodon purpureus]
MFASTRELVSPLSSSIRIAGSTYRKLQYAFCEYHIVFVVGNNCQKVVGESPDFNISYTCHQEDMNYTSTLPLLTGQGNFSQLRYHTHYNKMCFTCQSLP